MQGTLGMQEIMVAAGSRGGTLCAGEARCEQGRPAINESGHAECGEGMQRAGESCRERGRHAGKGGGTL